MRVRSAEPTKPVTCRFGPMAHPLELAACPANDIGIDPCQGWMQLRLVKVAVVVEPAADARVVHSSQLSQGFVAGCSAKSPLDRVTRKRRLRIGDAQLCE
jgi:hypothetical protein